MRLGQAGQQQQGAFVIAQGQRLRQCFQRLRRRPRGDLGRARGVRFEKPEHRCPARLGLITGLGTQALGQAQAHQGRLLPGGQR